MLKVDRRRKFMKQKSEKKYIHNNYYSDIEEE